MSVNVDVTPPQQTLTQQISDNLFEELMGRPSRGESLQIPKGLREHPNAPTLRATDPNNRPRLIKENTIVQDVAVEVIDALGKTIIPGYPEFRDLQKLRELSKDPHRMATEAEKFELLNEKAFFPLAN